MHSRETDEDIELNKTSLWWLVRERDTGAPKETAVIHCRRIEMVSYKMWLYTNLHHQPAELPCGRSASISSEGSLPPSRWSFRSSIRLENLNAGVPNAFSILMLHPCSDAGYHLSNKGEMAKRHLRASTQEASLC